MAYTIKQARPVLLNYLGLTEANASFIENTDNWGILYEKNTLKCVIFMMPLGENTSSPKVYFDVRDSGAEKFIAAWEYAEKNDLKFFCLGVKDENETYKNNVVSVEADIKTVLKVSGLENGRRSGSGTQLNIPRKLVPNGNVARAKSDKFAIFFAVIHKDFLGTYLEIFDNRLFQFIKNGVQDINELSEKEVIQLSTTAKECARQIIQKIYEYDRFEHIRQILKMNTNIKIDTDEICPEDVLYNVFYTAGSEQFNNEKRTFLDCEYEVIINNMNVPCRLTNQWCGFGEVGDEIQTSRNYLWALRDIINIHYDGIFKIENEGANAKLVCLAQDKINKFALVFNTSISKIEKKNRILFGAPGTGKSFKLNNDAKDLIGKITHDGIEVPEPNSFERVTFHPNYSYAQFIGTYKPVAKVIDGAEIISYDFIPGAFIRILVKALKNARDESEIKPYLLIIEEINRSNVAAVFGDVFQLLDRNSDGFSEYEIETSEDLRKFLARNTILGGKPDDYKKIRIPNNFYIWATMNSADQGVFPMDTAFKRRWEFEYIGIDENEKQVANYEIPICKNGAVSQKVNWNELRKAINDKLISLGVNEDKLLGPFFLSKSALDSAMSSGMNFVKLFESKVLMYLFEDAAKMKVRQLFTLDSDKYIYSEVCKKFEKDGIEVFILNSNVAHVDLTGESQNE
ncbi:MAG: AAA family ATPase [Treponema sp.]|nr:AAA family ATPase [Treponema sp.]